MKRHRNFGDAGVDVTMIIGVEWNGMWGLRMGSSGKLCDHDSVNTRHLLITCTVVNFSRKTLPMQQLAMGCTTGWSEFDSRRWVGLFLSDTVSIPTLGPTQPHIQWVPGALSLGVKRPGREADHSPPPSTEVKECVELYLHYPVRLLGVVLT
jgi:hypothetical protein